MPHELSREVLLDVSDLEPPEPLERTLDTAETLQPGQYLRMLHRRDPCMLYGNLDNNGFNYYQREGSTTAIELFIWREDDAKAMAAVETIIGKSIETSS